MTQRNNSVQIHLSEPSRTLAAEARWPIPNLDLTGLDYTGSVAAMEAHSLKYADELQARREFTGPNFVGCVRDVDYDSGLVAVKLEDGTVYAYPPHTYNRFKAYRS